MANGIEISQWENIWDFGTSSCESLTAIGKSPMAKALSLEFQGENRVKSP